MLLVGIPFIDLMSSWLLVKILANFNLSLADWFCPPHSTCSPDYVPTYFNIWLPLLLGYLYYFHVRHLGRTTLSLFWAYAFVIIAVGTVMSLLLYVIPIEWRFRAPWSWWIDIQTFIHLTILMWFARQASRISFSHAIVLIGLSNFLFEFGLVISNFVLAQLEGWAAAWDIGAFALANTLFALWVLARLDLSREKHQTDIERWIGSWGSPVFGVALRRPAARILPWFDSARGISKELLVALFVLNWLLHAYLRLRFWVVVDDFELAPFMMNMMFVFVYPPIWIVLVILLAYAVRVRQPTEVTGTTETTAKPTKPFLSPRYGSQKEPPTS